MLMFLSRVLDFASARSRSKRSLRSRKKKKNKGWRLVKLDRLGVDVSVLLVANWRVAADLLGDIDVANSCVLSVEDLGDLLESGSLGLNVD